MSTSTPARSDEVPAVLRGSRGRSPRARACRAPRRAPSPGSARRSRSASGWRPGAVLAAEVERGGVRREVVEQPPGLARPRRAARSAPAARAGGGRARRPWAGCRTRSPSKSVTMSSSSTSKPRSLSRSMRCSIRHISSARELLLGGELAPQRVVALLEQLDDLVRLDLVADRLAGLQVEQLGEDVLGRDGQVVLAASARTGRAAARRSPRRRGTPRTRRRCAGTARWTARRRPRRSRPGAAGRAAPPSRRPATAGCRRTGRALNRLR